MNLYTILNIFLFISLSVADTGTPLKCKYFINKYQISQYKCHEFEGEVYSLLVYYIILHIYLIIKKNVVI